VTSAASNELNRPQICAGFWARLFLGIPKIRVELRATSLVFASAGQAWEFPLERLTDASVSSRWPWCTLTVRFSGSGRPRELRGLPARRGAAFLALLQVQREQALRASLQVQRAHALVAPANSDFKQLYNQDGYVRHSQYQNWKRRYQHLEDRIYEFISERTILKKEMAPVADFLNCLRAGTEIIAQRNDKWVVQELERRREWFDTVESYPLTGRQREAIIRDEDASLVIAGPGTGKTSTVIAKVGYLLRVRDASAGEILVLSFSRKTVTELEERISARLADVPRISTFHALGLDIIAEVEGKKPSLSRLSEDDQQLKAFLKKITDTLLSDPATSESFRTFLVEHLRPERSVFEFGSNEEYIQHLKAQDLRSYNGELVKSHEELIIANWLYCHAIAYEYEAKYESDTATRRHAQYKPDFFLPEHGIYIEHFGVDRTGQTAPWIDAERYREGMEWKRALHQEHGTELVESYSYEHSEGQLLLNLEQKLRALGVEPRPISEEELKRTLTRRGETPRLVGLIASFLNLFKSAQWTLADLRRAAGDGAGSRRALCFLEIFGAVLSRYEKHLADAGEIDFHDMINRATEYVNEGLYTSPFRHILVDEFQDIAQGRCRLVKALIDRASDSRLFCVGDDCQAIYRFTGSDVAIMTKFKSHFGFTRKTELDQTFRLNAELLKLSSRFIGRNRAQIRKRLKATQKSGGAAATLWIDPAHDDEEAALRLALAAAREHANGEKASVLIIGRYNFSQPTDSKELLKDFPELDARFVTAHGSKGLEADYTVVLGVVAGRYGFPAEISDDPLLDLVLANRDTFPNAEERRLFYVALTRARRHVHILTSAMNPSSFANELREKGYRRLVVVEGAAEDTLVCPDCGGGTLMRRTGPYGEFWGCGNYPYCGARPVTCPTCGQGAMLASGAGFTCSEAACGGNERRCPRCREGMLISRTSEYGEFFGCSNFARGLPPCTYTEQR
jgi:DNA helicase-4